MRLRDAQGEAKCPVRVCRKSSLTFVLGVKHVFASGVRIMIEAKIWIEERGRKGGNTVVDTVTHQLKLRNVLQEQRLASQIVCAGEIYITISLPQQDETFTSLGEKEKAPCFPRVTLQMEVPMQADNREKDQIWRGISRWQVLDVSCLSKEWLQHPSCPPAQQETSQGPIS